MPIASVYLEWKMEWNSANKEFFMYMVDEVIVGHLLEVDTKYFSYLNEDII